MVLCDSEIRAALRAGHLVIRPEPTANQYTTTAVDLTLGGTFSRWKAPSGHGATTAIDPAAADFSFPRIARDHLQEAPTDEEGAVTLEPGGFLLGITAEWVELPVSSHLAARVEGRSTLARLGIGIHVTAPTVHSGFRGRITLEITNHSTLNIRLCPGLPICQLIFETVFGTPTEEMTGIFQNQNDVTGRE
ncbi:MAG TPA: dCTP deaminase [Armatimonadota bacterium]|jgi:dCTP deaminase